MLLRAQRMLDLFGASVRVRRGLDDESDGTKYRLYEGLMLRGTKLLHRYGFSLDYDLDKNFESKLLAQNPNLAIESRRLVGEYSNRWYADYHEQHGN